MKTNFKSVHKKYHDLQREVFNYFGYVEDWKVIPLDFKLDHYWMICGREDSSKTNVVFGLKPFTPLSIAAGKDFYSGTIYTQRHLPKWVYRGADFTMVAVDTHCDGNELLMIFENKLEVKEQALKDAFNARWNH